MHTVDLVDARIAQLERAIRETAEQEPWRELVARLRSLRWQAVQDHRLRPCRAKQLDIDAVGGEVTTPLYLLLLVAHARPDIGIEGIRADDGLAQVADDFDRAA